ncbi:hypothetical protein QJS66_14085 [Kocuria rhizophila]|nr:hypothetical protein QJS66_14085 [Kocuria rhizophila]
MSEVGRHGACWCWAGRTVVSPRGAGRPRPVPRGGHVQTIAERG